MHGGWDVSWQFERSCAEASNVTTESFLSGRTFIDSLNTFVHRVMTNAPDAPPRALQLLKLALLAMLRFLKLACERAMSLLSGAFSDDLRSRLISFVPTSFASLLQHARNAISANTRAFLPTASRAAPDATQNSLALKHEAIPSTIPDFHARVPLSESQHENAARVVADQAVTKFPFSPNMFAESKTKLKKNVRTRHLFYSSIFEFRPIAQICFRSFPHSRSPNRRARRARKRSRQAKRRQ